MTESILTRLKKASLATGATMRRRDELIVEAAAKHSFSVVAEAAEISKARVAQIVAASRKS